MNKEARFFFTSSFIVGRTKDNSHNLATSLGSIFKFGPKIFIPVDNK